MRGLHYGSPVSLKFLVMTQHSWVEKKREERKQEFAPPSAFTGSDTSRPRKFAKHQDPIIKTETVISEDSIISGLAFMKQMQFPRSDVQPSPPNKYDGKHDVAEEEENDNSIGRWAYIPMLRGWG